MGDTVRRYIATQSSLVLDAEEILGAVVSERVEVAHRPFCVGGRVALAPHVLEERCILEERPL